MTNQIQNDKKTKIQFKTGMDYIKDLLHIRNRLLYIEKNCKFNSGTTHNLVSSSIVNANRMQQLVQEKDQSQKTIEKLKKQNAILQEAIGNVEQKLNQIINNLSMTQNSSENVAQKIDTLSKVSDDDKSKSSSVSAANANDRDLSVNRYLKFAKQNLVKLAQYSKNTGSKIS